MINKKILLLVLVIISISLFTRLSNLKNFYSETDDQLPIIQLISYDTLSLYDIANDISSPSYNSSLKNYLRTLQLKKSNLIDNTQIFVSNILFNLVPSKHSTYAPLQFLMFGWMIDEEKSYNDLKFYSRLPSVFFSLLAIFMTYLLSKKVFKNEIYFVFLPSLLMTCSYPIIYISQRSYNYSAAVFSITLLFYLFLREVVNSNNLKLFINEKNIKIKKNFYFSIILAFTSYLTYLSIVLMPIFFLFKFANNFLKDKKFLTISNYNLVICGLMYSIIILPLLYYMFIQGIHTRGMSSSTGGVNFEYSITTHQDNYLKFFLYTTYLIIVKNLSFFLDDFAGANIVQGFIFFITSIGTFFIFHKSTQNNYKILLCLFFICILYWFLLVLLNITSLGPTKHLLILTPIFAIIFTYGLKILNKFIFKKEKIFSISVFLTVILIFFLNYSNFLYYYKDVFHEKEIANLIKKHNVQYIINHPSHGNTLCIMPSIKVEIKSCPIRYARHNNPDGFNVEPNQSIYKNIKKNKGSILFVNYNITQKIKSDLMYNGFDKTLTIQKKKITMARPLVDDDVISYADPDIIMSSMGNSPLHISKYNPNSIELIIYK